MTCIIGNSLGWPRKRRNPPFFVKTVPLLILKPKHETDEVTIVGLNKYNCNKYNSLSVLYIIELHSHFWLFLLSPVKIPVNDHFQAHVTSWGYISNITSSTGKLNLRRYRGPQKILKSIYKDIFLIFATKNAILKNKNYMPCIRKDPFELSPPYIWELPK